jgi:transmembrane sensor
MESPELEKRLLELEEKWFNHTITPEEAQEYADWYNAHQEDPIIIPESFAANDAVLEARILKRIRSRTKPAPVRTLYRRVAVAAAILLLAGAGAYYITNHKPRVVAAVPKDIAAPVGTHTILTLVNGLRVKLDSLQNGSVTLQGNT